MRTGSVVAMIVTAAMTASASEHIGPQVETMNAPAFGTVTVYQPGRRDTAGGVVSVRRRRLESWCDWHGGTPSPRWRARGRHRHSRIRAKPRGLRELRVPCRRPRRALTRCAVALQVAPLPASDSGRLLIGCHHGLRGHCCRAAGDIRGRHQPGVLSERRACDFVVCHARPEGDQTGRGTGYGLAPFKESTVPWMVLQGESRPGLRAEHHACVRGRDWSGAVVLVATGGAWVRSHPELGAAVCPGVSGYRGRTTECGAQPCDDTRSGRPFARRGSHHKSQRPGDVRHPADGRRGMGRPRQESRGRTERARRTGCRLEQSRLLLDTSQPRRVRPPI